MKRILLTALLIITANTVAATSLSIKHNKDLPTPYELITKGKILDKQSKEGSVVYYIDWDKTDDIYRCALDWNRKTQVAVAKCHLSIQDTLTEGL